MEHHNIEVPDPNENSNDHQDINGNFQSFENQDYRN
jgi:hypothetical protein